MYFRDHIKTARHLGENRVIIRAKEHARSLQARSRTESPFSNLFKDCGSDVQYAGVAQAIEHWLAGQSEKLGNVWVEYDGKTIPDIQSYEQKQARMDAEMAIVWRKE